jgi:hypothetical protein
MSKLNRAGLRAMAAAALGLAWALAHARTPAATEDQALDSLIREAMLYAYPYQEFMKMRHEALEVKTRPPPPRSTTSATRATWPQGPLGQRPDSRHLLLHRLAGSRKVSLVLSLPETHGRYYVIAMIGADLNTFSYVGRRIGGTKARKVALVGPRWSGKIRRSTRSCARLRGMSI